MESRAQSTRGFARLEPNLFQDLSLTREFCPARWKTAPRQDERQNIGGLLTAQAPRVVLRHRNLDALEQIVDREPAPVLLELTAGQRGLCFAAREVGPVTARTVLRIERPSPLRLLLGIDAIPNGLRAFRRGCRRLWRR